MGFSLYLYPAISHRPFTIKQLAEFFSQQQFGLVTDQPEHLLVGPRLMQHITYLGCSPALSSGGNDSEIYLHQFTTIKGMGGNSIEMLRYPRCKHNIANPAALLLSPPSANWLCGQCDNSGLISEINWRKSAAYADFFIEITSIFPKEAIPSEQFIQSMYQISDSNWSWFYSSSSHS